MPAPAAASAAAAAEESQHLMTCVLSCTDIAHQLLLLLHNHNQVSPGRTGGRRRCGRRGIRGEFRTSCTATAHAKRESAPPFISKTLVADTSRSLLKRPYLSFYAETSCNLLPALGKENNKKIKGFCLSCHERNKMTVQFEGDDVEHFTKVRAIVPWQITAFLVFIRHYLQSIHGFCALSGAKVPEIGRQMAWSASAVHATPADCFRLTYAAFRVTGARYKL